MKKITLVFFIVLATFTIKAQDADTSWKVNSDISLMMSQASFTNWSAGGENSLTFNGYFNFSILECTGGTERTELLLQ